MNNLGGQGLRLNRSAYQYSPTLFIGLPGQTGTYRQLMIGAYIRFENVGSSYRAGNRLGCCSESWRHVTTLGEIFALSRKQDRFLYGIYYDVTTENWGFAGLERTPTRISRSLSACMVG